MSEPEPEPDPEDWAARVGSDDERHLNDVPPHWR